MWFSRCKLSCLPRYQSWDRDSKNLVSGLGCWRCRMIVKCYLPRSRHPLSSSLRHTVRRCTEWGSILIWLANIGGISSLDTTLWVSKLPESTCRHTKTESYLVVKSTSRAIFRMSGYRVIRRGSMTSSFEILFIWRDRVIFWILFHVIR